VKTVAVLGTGGFGTALASVAVAAGRRARLWGRDPAHVARIARTRRNERALPGATLDASIELVADARRAVDGADLVIAAVPAQFARATLAPFRELLSPAIPVASGAKGIEIGTGLRPTEVLAATLGPRPLAILTGPSHAEEIMQGLPASLAIASADVDLARRIRDALASARLRLYVETDPIGAELAGALKNVLAIAAGVCDGLQLGDNAKAALVTRALAEMTRFGVARGARAETFAGLAGIGDLLTTSYSRHGRNRAVGERLAHGERIEAILASMTQVAEGVGTARALGEAGALRDGAMPICGEVHAILFEGKDPRRSVLDLMTRPPRDA